ncbi:MAG: hypothetical protein QMD78_06005 [Methanocellales archaeon]|nr:hypothetical protein [Methanocellales archaeon]
MLIVGATMVSAQGAERGLPVGKEISVAVHEILIQHRADVEDFIYEHKYAMAEMQEKRLRLIEEKQATLRATIDEVEAERQALIVAHRSGTIGEDAFVVVMKELEMKVSMSARSREKLGPQLAELNQEMAEDLRANAQELANKNQELANEMAECGRAIGEKMRERGYKPREDLPTEPEEVSAATPTPTPVPTATPSPSPTPTPTGEQERENVTGEYRWVNETAMPSPSPSPENETEIRGGEKK